VTRKQRDVSFGQPIDRPGVVVDDFDARHSYSLSMSVPHIQHQVASGTVTLNDTAAAD
jgi:hypothetical protein